MTESVAQHSTWCVPSVLQADADGSKSISLDEFIVFYRFAGGWVGGRRGQAVGYGCVARQMYCIRVAEGMAVCTFRAYNSVVYEGAYV